MSEKICHFRELRVYKLAKEIAFEIFELTKECPPTEKYLLIDQIRRASRSVCTNIAEAWRKRRYPAAFIAKLNDSEGECSETQVELEFSLDYKYIDESTFKRLDEKCDRVTAMLVQMSNQPEKWSY